MATIASTARARQSIGDPEAPITRQEAEDLHEHMRGLEIGLGQKVNNISAAVFGNPMDSDDHGIVGDIREVGRKLDRVFHSILGTCGVLVVVAVTIALAVHH